MGGQFATLGANVAVINLEKIINEIHNLRSK
jgi:hypothetical protein